MKPEIYLGIDEEFSALAWKLTDEERVLLAVSLRGPDGCRDPIRYWHREGVPLDESPIVDGHNRYSICKEHGLDFAIEGMQFPDRAAVIDWIIRNQLGRRNASEVQKSHLRGKLHLERQLQPPSDSQSFDCHAVSRDIEDVDTEQVKGPQTPARPKQPKARPLSSLAGQIAKETGVSERTIHRDTEFAKALDAIGEQSPKLKEAVLKKIIAKKDAVKLAGATPEVIAGLEATPQGQLRAAASAAVKSVENHKPRHPETGVLVIDVRSLAALEKQAGVLVRLKSKALNDCGGKTCAWAMVHHETVRHALNAIFDAIVAWKKEASQHIGEIKKGKK